MTSEDFAFPETEKTGVFKMEKNYRIYSDSDAPSKNSKSEKKEVIEAVDHSHNNSGYYMAGTKDAMTSNKVYSMY